MIPDLLQKYSYLLSQDYGNGRYELGGRSAVHTLRREKFTGVALSLASGVTFYVCDTGAVEVGRYPYFASDTRYFFIYTYRDGMLHGTVSIFYLTGSIEYSANYRHGKLHGREMSFFENGVIDHVAQFEQNFYKGTYISFHSNGRIHAIGTVCGEKGRALKDGECKTFSRKGHLMSVGGWSEGLENGLHREFYKTGILRKEGSWTAGVKHGRFRNFFDDGSLQFECEYFDGEAIGYYKQYAKDHSVCWLKTFNEI